MNSIPPNRFKTRLWKIVATLSACFVFSFFAVAPAWAQLDSATSVAESAGLATTDLYTIIGTIIKVFFSLLGIVFLALTLYAGWLWMTAGGEEAKVEKAKDILIRAVVGLVITLAAYSITTFIINALTDAGLFGTGGGGGGSSSSLVSTEARSGSLGDGITDHYPERGATDVSRNTRIFVTFADAMNIESFITGYDVGTTPEDVTDDTVATALNTDNIKIYVTAEGEDNYLTSDEVTVAFTDDLKTFVFYPPVLGSSTEDTNYTVLLDDPIENTDGDEVINGGGYEWSFTVGTEIDLDPPTVSSVRPADGGTYDRNITVEITFSEAVDPTSASGTREADSGFDNIQTTGTDDVPVPGEYTISNGYRTVTFTTDSECGTNSCGETIYCLPASQLINALIKSATPGTSPPQVDTFPYDGVVDTSGNTLDGLNDSTYADYEWSFTTTNDISLDAPEVESITPDIGAEDIDLDQPVIITFGCDNSETPDACDSVMMTSTITSSHIGLHVTPEHELSFYFRSIELTSDDVEVTSTEQTAAKLQSTVNHGTFLEPVVSGDTTTPYVYDVYIDQGVRNQYQNCFSPGAGPGDGEAATCGTTAESPYCCDGVAQTTACSYCGTTEALPYCCAGVAQAEACSN